jgi:DNA repair protein RadC
MKDNPHKGHRNRLRKRFLCEDLENFEPHEVLEMLLYEGTPLKDTNIIAHELLREYGSFSAVVQASPEELKKFKDMTETSSIALSMLPQLVKYYRMDKIRNRTDLKSIGRVNYYIKALLRDSVREEFYLLCLDANHQLLNKKLIRRGSINKINIDIREVAELVCRMQATSIVIAHSHPSGIPEPSQSDDEFTMNLFMAMALINVHLLDHIIVSGENTYSYWENDRLNDFRREYARYTKTPFLGERDDINNFYEDKSENEKVI